MNWRRTSTTVAAAAATVFDAFVRPGSLLRRVGAMPVGVNRRPCAGSHCATGWPPKKLSTAPCEQVEKSLPSTECPT